MKNRGFLRLFCMGLFLIPALACSFNSKLMSKDLKLNSLSNLEAYKSSERNSLETFRSENYSQPEDCPNRHQSSPQTEYCHIKYYTDGEFLVVEIGYVRDKKFPVEPSAKFVRGLEPPNNWDRSAVEDHLLTWSDEVFKHFIGKDYSNFSKIELRAINSQYIIISFHILEPTELREVVQNPEIAFIRHVADPIDTVEEFP